MKGFLLLVVLFTCASPLKAIEPDHGNLSGLSEAYGFVLGQNLSLDRIAGQYPDLAREVLLAKLAFERTFGDIHGQLNPKFIEFLGEETLRPESARRGNEKAIGQSFYKMKQGHS